MNRPAPMDPATSVAEAATDALNRAATQGGDAVRELAAKVAELTQRSVGQWRSQAEIWHDDASEHIRSHPLRSVLIAAAGGTVLAVLWRALNR